MALPVYPEAIQASISFLLNVKRDTAGREKLKVFGGPQRRLKPVVNIYLSVKVINMGFDGMQTDGKLIRHDLAAVSGSDTGKYFFFSECQTGHGRMC